MAKKKKVPRLEETAHVKAIREFCKELHTKGWKTAHITYQGSGDSCDDFNFSLENEETTVDFRTVKPADLPAHFDARMFENSLWDLLPDGFENNEGGDGSIKIDIGTGEICVTHNEYHLESTKTEWKY